MKPWDERKRSIFPIQEELSKKTYSVAGIRAPVFLPAALPSAGFFPIEFVIASTADHRGIGQVRPAAGARSRQERPIRISARDGCAHRPGKKRNRD